MTSNHGQEPAPHRIEPGRSDTPPAPPRSPSGVSAAQHHDEWLRVKALELALSFGADSANEIVAEARIFEAYLRENGGDVIEATTDPEAYA